MVMHVVRLVSQCLMVCHALRFRKNCQREEPQAKVAPNYTLIERPTVSHFTSKGELDNSLLVRHVCELSGLQFSRLEVFDFCGFLARLVAQGARVRTLGAPSADAVLNRK